MQSYANAPAQKLTYSPAWFPDVTVNKDNSRSPYFCPEDAEDMETFHGNVRKLLQGGIPSIIFAVKNRNHATVTMARASVVAHVASHVGSGFVVGCSQHSRSSVLLFVADITTGR